jgi:hypothetical protein
VILNTRTHLEREKARSILINKEWNKINARNWRSITITDNLCRVIYCKIAKSLHEVHEDGYLNIHDIEQKDFVLKRAGCIEHTAIANPLMSD